MLSRSRRGLAHSEMRRPATHMVAIAALVTIDTEVSASMTDTTHAGNGDLKCCSLASCLRRRMAVFNAAENSGMLATPISTSVPRTLRMYLLITSAPALDSVSRKTRKAAQTLCES